MTVNAKVAIVTGAAQGIGKAIAQKFIDEGAVLAICDMDEEALEETAELLGKRGTVFSQRVDVANEAAVHHFIDEVDRRFHTIDVLANNAGISPVASFLDMTPLIWERTMDVNLNSMFLVSQAVAKVMVRQGGGSIVNMSSTNGLFGEKGLAAYNASKAGVILLTKTMALELAAYQIRVNAVCPGFIRTNLARSGGFDQAFLDEYTSKIPLGRSGTPEEVAELFSFLSFGKAEFITGQSFVIDGGQTIGQ